MTWTATGSGRVARLLILSTLLSLCAVLAPGEAMTRAVGAPPGACTTEQGVIVAVDFGHWGGSIQRGCDPNPSTGYNALRTAGFAAQGTQHDGPGFICRINNMPTPAEDACVLTPPADAYWSYWHAEPGQSGWSYGTLGAMSYQPKPGSVDAWVFGATDIGGSTGGPSFSPAVVRADTPAPPPAHTTAAGEPPAAPAPPPAAPASPPAAADPTAPVQPGGAPAPGTTAAVPGGGAPSRSPSADPRASTSTADDGATASDASPSSPDSSARSEPSAPSTDTSGPAIVDVDPRAASAEHGRGSPAGVLAFVALCVVLGAAAAAVMLRRRQGR